MKNTLRQEMINAVKIIAINDYNSRSALCFLSGYLKNSYPDISEIISALLDYTCDSDLSISDSNFEKGFNSGYSYMREKIENALK